MDVLMSKKLDINILARSVVKFNDQYHLRIYKNNSQYHVGNVNRNSVFFYYYIFTPVAFIRYIFSLT